MKLTYGIVKEVTKREAKLGSPAERVVLQVDFRLEHVRIEQFQVRLLIFAGGGSVPHLFVVDRVEVVVLEQFHFESTD